MHKLLLLSLLLPLLTVAQTATPTRDTIDVYPDGTWDRIINPGDYGWDNAALKQLRKIGCVGKNVCQQLY